MRRGSLLRRSGTIPASPRVSSVGLPESSHPVADSFRRTKSPSDARRVAMDTPQLPDKSESVELFEVKWLSDAQRQRYGGPQALHTLCLSDTDMELLQMG